MIGFTLLAAIIGVTLAGLAVLCVVATRPAELQPATVTPFGYAGVTDPAADTMNGGRCESTLAGDWQEVEVSRLSDAEDLLDALEAQNVRYREMAIAGNDKFLVRWR